MYAYGLIGNCQISALISEAGSLDWMCLPRPDSEPVFGRLLDPDGGNFTVAFASASQTTSRQRYEDNANILVTEMQNQSGDGFRIIDFCPRFLQSGHIYRPIRLFRIVEPVAGSPMITAGCHPIDGWSRQSLGGTRGPDHLRFDVHGGELRLSTNMPVKYLESASPFQLKEKLYFALTWNSPLDADLATIAEESLRQTREYWQTWVKHCSIPVLFQREVIRSALTLKLHVYEETGAILAAPTTSLPEHPGSERNWDYRFCWLRDAYFVLSAFHNLGQFEEMEGFLKFLLNIAHQREQSEARLAPVYTLDRRLPLPECTHAAWRGYQSSQPVRSNNQAAEHVQNDVYGEMVLTLSPIFFDERFNQLRTREHADLLAHLGLLCARTISVPDAGLWEVRNGWQEHSFSNLMCWAGLERIERIRRRGFSSDLTFDPAAETRRAEAAVRRGIRDGILRNGPTDQTLDSALALLPVFHFPDTDLSARTLAEIRRTLAADDGAGNFLYRYRRNDDFGTPQSAFVICSFWLAQGLAAIGQRQKAVEILQNALGAANSLGLYAEHYLPNERRQLGNFPQAYSHVGLINAAFAASPTWMEVL